jgi:hypothetical protein
LCGADPYELAVIPASNGRIDGWQLMYQNATDLSGFEFALLLCAFFQLGSSLATRIQSLL